MKQKYYIVSLSSKGVSPRPQTPAAWALDSWSSQVSAENTVSDVSPPAPQVSLRPPIPDCQHHPLGGQGAGGLSGMSLLARPERLVHGHLSQGQARWAAGLLSPSPIWLIPRDPCRMAMLTVLHRPPALSSPRVFSATERNASMMHNA